jgi:2-polyprenyl-3-methyl-5-hydroxy-6-metoxy-1,4-benzoquinol methylase
MDRTQITTDLFHRFADSYRAKYADLALYNDSYREFCELLPRGSARVLDAACGPGNVSRYLASQRPDLDLLGIDLAPRMVELARESVPSARFLVHDCVRLAELTQRFDGIICAFGLPYLSQTEAGVFVNAAFDALEPGGVLYLSTMLGNNEESGFQTCSTGDQIYITYYSEDQVTRLLQRCGFAVDKQIQMPSPSSASKATTDLIVIARK